MANEKKGNFWGDFASKAAGAAAGPLGELGVSMLASTLLKPNQNPYLATQQADYARKRRLNNYYDSYLKSQQDLYNKYNPVYQKTTDMAIEAANKPLTGTDIFKGMGAINDIQNTQNQQSQAAASRVATNNGLYGGARAGIENSVRNSNNSAINKSLADFSANYEANAPARLAGAQGMAAGAYGNAAQGMFSGLGALNQNYSDLMAMGQGLGQQELDTRNDLFNRQTGLMQMLGDMFENQNNQRMFNKQLQQNKDLAEKSMSMYDKAGGYGYGNAGNAPGLSMSRFQSPIAPHSPFFSSLPNNSFTYTPSSPIGGLRRPMNPSFNVYPQ